MMDHAPLSILQFCSARSLGYGATASMLNLSLQLKADGQRIECATIEGKPLGQELRELGFISHELRNKTKLDIQLIFQLRNLIRKEKFHVLHAHMNTAALNGIIAARLAKIPSVTTVHGMSFKVPYCFANRIIAVSQACRRHLIHQNVRAEKISVVYNGIDLSRFSSTGREPQAKREFGFYTEDFVVGMTSRVTKQKGIGTALRAIANKKEMLPSLRFLMVGEGSDLDELKRIACELEINDRVVFAGFQDDVRRALSAMDLFVFPSLKEAMGISLVEAMATGLPVVATTVGGIPEVVVNGETGLLVAPDDAEALGNAIEVIARDASLGHKMGAKGNERVRDLFTVEAMASAMERIYLEACAEFPASAKAAARA